MATELESSVNPQAGKPALQAQAQTICKLRQERHLPVMANTYT
jgi:hypothetical protein